ncbi:hypothetical protein C8J57DRAFT_1236957 [Mycena rebaudengoi]|nr:hypothetical protein C8J57DRAFT_1236957 [Mycena rebaudengoi]
MWRERRHLDLAAWWTAWWTARPHAGTYDLHNTARTDALWCGVARRTGSNDSRTPRDAIMPAKAVERSEYPAGASKHNPFCYLRQPRFQLQCPPATSSEASASRARTAPALATRCLRRPSLPRRSPESPSSTVFVRPTRAHIIYRSYRIAGDNDRDGVKTARSGDHPSRRYSAATPATTACALRDATRTKHHGRALASETRTSPTRRGTSPERRDKRSRSPVRMGLGAAGAESGAQRGKWCRAQRRDRGSAACGVCWVSAGAGGDGRHGMGAAGARWPLTSV